MPRSRDQARQEQIIYDLIIKEFLPKERFTVDDIYCHESGPGDLSLYAAIKQLEFEKVIQKVTRVYDDKDHTTMWYCRYTPKGQDGYRSCHCRDCFNTTIGPAGELCDECEEADCDPKQECQGKHAYETHCGDESCCGEEEDGLE